MSTIDMKNLGLSQRFSTEATLCACLYIGRIISQYKNLYKVATENGEITAQISGKFRFDVKVLSDYSDEGYLSVKNYLGSGKTVAFIGSSGVGKSTLINKLIGENTLITKEIRNDDKGRHATTRREIIVLPSGGVVIDTPGMREIGIESADLSKTFADIDELSKKCKFLIALILVSQAAQYKKLLMMVC